MELFSLLFFGVWTFIGAVFLLIVLILYRIRRTKSERCTLRVPAEVAEVVRYRNQSGGTYYPVLEYRVNGTVLRVKSNWGSRPAKYEKGQRVTVCCDPEKPKSFYIEEDRSPVLLEKIFLFIGLGCILIGSIVGYVVLRAA